jgi:hypothetical protein
MECASRTSSIEGPASHHHFDVSSSRRHGAGCRQYFLTSGMDVWTSAASARLGGDVAIMRRVCESSWHRNSEGEWCTTRARCVDDTTRAPFNPCHVHHALLALNPACPGASSSSLCSTKSLPVCKQPPSSSHPCPRLTCSRRR